MLDGLEPADGLAELHALLGVGQGVLEGGTADAESKGRGQQPDLGQDLTQARDPLADLAENAGGWGLVEGSLRGE